MLLTSWAVLERRQIRGLEGPRTTRPADMPDTTTGLGKRGPAARNQMRTFQELADEAFGDLLKKKNRPVNLKDALRKSAGHSASVHQLHPTRKKQAKRQDACIHPASHASAS